MNINYNKQINKTKQTKENLIMKNKTNLFGTTTNRRVQMLRGFEDDMASIELLTKNDQTVVMNIKNRRCEIPVSYGDMLYDVLKMNITDMSLITSNIGPMGYYFIPVKLKKHVDVTTMTLTNVVIELVGEDESNYRVGNYLILPLRYSSKDAYGFCHINNEDKDGNAVVILTNDEDCKNNMEKEIRDLEDRR